MQDIYSDHIYTINIMYLGGIKCTILKAEHFGWLSSSEEICFALSRTERIV